MTLSKDGGRNFYHGAGHFGRCAGDDGVAGVAAVFWVGRGIPAVC